ncbi:hypothetical protein ACK1M2_001715 [Providencia rettgeri]
METGTLTVNISMKKKWWVSPYLSALKLFCLTLRIEPNYQRVGDFIAKYGLVTTIESQRTIHDLHGFKFKWRR